MTKKKKATKGWMEKKLMDPEFRSGFEEEYENISLGEQLYRLRTHAHLTQEALAKKIGTTRSAISRYENVSYDSYELGTLRKIVKACGGELKVLISA